MKVFIYILGAIILALAVWYGYSNCCQSNNISPENKTDQGAIVKGVESGESLLLDVRSEGEWNAEHAKGAFLFPLELLQVGELPPLNKEKKIYVYCRTGSRAEEAKKILEQNGFKDVSNLGGLTDWQNMGGKIYSTD